ncbi:MAG: GNAT family N-acetyltransferase [Chloroflexota bacterium]|nr:GNAT family N-acetyltransferase [Chloroflexota bacterium]PLS81577.1 MAG: GNAT family N-acetyltransferase [Chloroflexota bacterium]
MPTVCLHDKAAIAAFLRRSPYLHLYTLGDLDDFFWPYTTWYGLTDAAQQLRQVVLVYTASLPPTLLALADETPDSMRELLGSLLPLLPRQLHAHVSGQLAEVFHSDYTIQSFGPHYKMALLDLSRLRAFEPAGIEQLTAADLPQIRELYQASYPGNWFDPRMLATGFYYGARRDNKLVSIAGVHVYSQEYNAAAIGNVTTLPELRGQGLGTAVCARLCQALLRSVSYVGLNVKVDNHSAIRAYERLGFQRIASYEECGLALKTGTS